MSLELAVYGSAWGREWGCGLDILNLLLLTNVTVIGSESNGGHQTSLVAQNGDMAGRAGYKLCFFIVTALVTKVIWILLSSGCLQIVFGLSSGRLHVFFILSSGCPKLVFMFSTYCLRVVFRLSSCFLHIVFGLS